MRFGFFMSDIEPPTLLCPQNYTVFLQKYKEVELNPYEVPVPKPTGKIIYI